MPKVFSYHRGTSGKLLSLTLNLKLNFLFRGTLSVPEGEANQKNELATVVITVMTAAIYLGQMFQEPC